MATQTKPTEPLTDYSPMPFGKHRGKRMIDVPAPYLIWLYESGCDHPQVKQYINDNLDVLNQENAKAKR